MVVAWVVVVFDKSVGDGALSGDIRWGGGSVDAVGERSDDLADATNGANGFRHSTV